MVISNRKSLQKKTLTESSPVSVRKKVATITDYWRKGYRKDNQIPNPVEAKLYRSILNPIRARFISWQLQNRYLTADDLPHLDYAFYPLHTEPEITINVYARPYLNQIEALRLISHSLPVHWKLVVKEHPATNGRRPTGYYEKLLEILNVCLVPPGMPASFVARHARLVTILTGSVALEAMMSQVPVLILGNSPFDFLPRSMVRRVRDPCQLASEGQDLYIFIPLR